MTKPCAYPGCTVQFTPTNNRQRFHDRHESWRLSNKKWYAAHKEQKAAINNAYGATFGGYLTKRQHQLRALRERTEERLAALEREEQKCLMLWGSQTQTK